MQRRREFVRFEYFIAFSHKQKDLKVVREAKSVSAYLSLASRQIVVLESFQTRPGVVSARSSLRERTHVSVCHVCDQLSGEVELTIFSLGLLISKADSHFSHNCIMLVKAEWNPRRLKSTSSRWRKVLCDVGIDLQY
jgi:hypothetical protein